MDEYPAGEFVLPLFPLPNLVFFPQTRIPLHIFEPRYRQMIADVLTGEERFGSILLRPGWENDYFGSPPLHEFGTVGKVEQAIPLEGGKYNIIVRGVVRFRLIEFVSEKPYRLARVEAVPERQPEAMEAWAQREWLEDLARRYLEYLPGSSEVPELSSASLDSLTNALAMSLDIDPQEKQKLLEQEDVLHRAREVGELLGRRLEKMKVPTQLRPGGSDPTLN
jgi:uncharacterized protein